jgi:pimeloyl-ACP methyl ester carboxylesterase
VLRGAIGGHFLQEARGADPVSWTCARLPARGGAAAFAREEASAQRAAATAPARPLPSDLGVCRELRNHAKGVASAAGGATYDRGRGLVAARAQVIMLPGAVLPAEVAYGALLEALGEGVEAVAKGLELYAGEEPSQGYTLDTEIEGILRAARASGFDRFHLVGYSGGGAASLAFAAKHPERLRSLALLEPAWAGNEGLDPAEEAVWREYDRIMALPPEERMPAFVRAQLGRGVEPPPPPGPPPPWMAKRPAGLNAFIEAFKAGELELDALRRLEAPVYFALGGLSNPDQYAQIAERLSRVFPDFTLEVFQERHHFDPPHRAEPDRLASSLRDIWARAETVSVAE